MHIEILTEHWLPEVRKLIDKEFEDKDDLASYVDMSKSYVALDGINTCTTTFGCSRPQRPKLAGFILVESDGYVAYLIVGPRWRNRGLGTTLLRKARHHVKSLTCAPELGAYYESRGFIQTGSVKLKCGYLMNRYERMPDLDERISEAIFDLRDSLYETMASCGLSIVKAVGHALVPHKHD